MRDRDEGFVPIGEIVKQLVGDAATSKAVRFVVIDPMHPILMLDEDESVLGDDLIDAVLDGGTDAA
jgi:hypothetical protein